MDSKGFTLVELMVVVVIIGILVAIIIPVYNGIQDRAAIRTHEANLRTIDEAIAMYIANYGHEPQGAGVAAIDELISEGFLTERPVVPKRLLEHPEWFAPPYDNLLSLLKEPYSIETLYYEIHSTTDENSKAFPVLESGNYGADRIPNDTGSVVVNFISTYYPGS